MATSLRDNLTSSYFNAAHKLYPKKARRRIIAYVESYDDIAFWRTLLEEFEDDEHYFQVMLPSATSLAKGKKMVLMNTLNTAELGRSLIACVDSDYDFLLQGATNTSRKINRSRYIFQTYTYAIENYHCFAESLHEVCVQATLNDRSILDFRFSYGTCGSIANGILTLSPCTISILILLCARLISGIRKRAWNPFNNGLIRSWQS